jgi:hypothetical protein
MVASCPFPGTEAYDIWNALIEKYPTYASMTVSNQRFPGKRPLQQGAREERQG